MKYKYTVKKDGVLYKPGTEVPDGLPMKAKLSDSEPKNTETAKQAPEQPKRGRKPKEE